MVGREGMGGIAGKVVGAGVQRCWDMAACRVGGQMWWDGGWWDKEVEKGVAGWGG